MAALLSAAMGGGFERAVARDARIGAPDLTVALRLGPLEAWSKLFVGVMGFPNAGPIGCISYQVRISSNLSRRSALP